MLGIGGARALAALGIKPTRAGTSTRGTRRSCARAHARLIAGGLDFEAALEAVAANTVFTTHTAVPAGHDHFAARTMVRTYLASACRELGTHARRSCSPSARSPNGQRLQHDRARAARLALPERRVAHPRRRLRARSAPTSGRRSTREENPITLRHQRRARADLPRAGLARGVRPATSAAAGSAGSTDPARCWREVHGMPDHMFWSVRQHAEGRRCCTSCAIACARSTSATTAARRTSTACCKLADPGEPERAHHRLRAPLRDLQARDAAVRRPRAGCARSSAIRSGRCCSSSRARRTRPTSPARS